MNKALEGLKAEFISDVLDTVEHMDDTKRVNEIIHQTMLEVEDDLRAFVTILRSSGNF